jgi:hypothetical protein
MTSPFLSLLPQTRRALTAGVIALACVPAFATVFTNNTSIGVGNTNYDGTAIVVTNCTLTVDGPHAFSSVLVAAGGVLTHSFYPNGSISNPLFITNESQVLSGTNPVTLLNSNVITATVAVTDSTGTIAYTNGVDYLLTSPDGIVTQLQRTTNSSIPDGATVLVSYEVQTPAVPAGLNLSVTGNVEVDVGGAINANGNGYGGGLGTGSGRSSSGSFQDGSGAGYGGIGGMSSSNALGGATYGSFTQPANLGSGGGAGYAGAGGAGGGMIEIVAGGSVIANGSISANGANGTNARSGGGSGGSVWLAALTLSGSGVITANGGSGDPTHGGGGGGGRIAVQCGATSFAGSMTAYGGAGANIGGAGTVFTQLTGENGLLVVDNGGQSGTNTLVAVQDNTINVLIQGNAGVMPSGAWTFGNLTIASNGLLLASPLTPLTLTAAGAITIEKGGGMLANGAGYAGGAGSGAGHAYNDGFYRPCGGGGYGGNGAAGSPTNGTGGAAYGYQTDPSGFGSGGGTLPPYSFGGSGGGAIQITSLSGIVQVDGTIAANGGIGSGSGGGGGSGGSIWLTGGTLLGSGSITANGGNGADSIGGGGGGGRIDINPTADLFDGTISAYGGGGNWGGAGTVLIQVPGQNAQLILDNGGNSGTNTLVQSASATDLIVRGGAIGSASSSVSFANLYLNANGWLAPAYSSSAAATLTFSFTGNATVEAGGGIVADFAGYAGGQGPGEGHTAEAGSTWYCSGGGHGGTGGNSFSNSATGGTAYDSMMTPSNPGSGGGAYSSLSPGGPGGGVIRLTVTGTLEMDGIISANGGNGSGFSGGGGSGGSIWLAVGTLSGAGSIAANGGSGVDALGGGGGGGMIYIPCNNNSFSGTITAYGGGGANWGGTGPTIIQLSGKNSQLILDGGGHSGPATPLLSSGTANLTLRNGAVGLSGASLSLGNVLISSNSWLLVSNSGSYVSAMTMSSATIQAGGGIIADFEGYAAGQGSGAGRSYASSPTYPCSGAGHGGNGGNSISNLAAGGGAYDSQTSPDLLGSGGGTEAPYSVGGPGGGGFQLTVTGLLQVDGIISANGGSGSGSGGGGGSGGSIYLSAGTLAGAGSITANGGSGAGSIGGGGAGGCIAISPTVNQFAGAISAYGGGGANWGGAGTVYIQTNGQNGQFILDNAGNSGAATPIQSGSSSTGLVVRNGAVGLPPGNLGNVLVNSNAWLLLSNMYPLSLTFSSATIQAGGGFIADSAGYAAGQGSGAGHYYSSSPTYPCSGAGHGGNGANSISNLAAGGSTYDSPTSPGQFGSGGGTESPYSVGGAGGGAFHVTVTGLLQVDGAISANGGNGGGAGGGGGSGGSIWLTVGTLSGAGSIRANGGSGAGSIGGGGAGGCIAIYPTANQFAGAISAYGGGGANWGGAGTVYIQTSGQNGQLILDNAGQSGAITPIQSGSSSTGLILRNGAVGLPGASLSLGSVLISSNGWLLVSNPQSEAALMTFTNATIQAGGGITADSEGYPAGQGNGAGHYYANSPAYPCSGAGHGGNGGYGFEYFAVGGSAYDNQTSPDLLGSGGGMVSPFSVGGAGGGAFHLVVTGLLQLDGAISANGGNGSGSGGGGGSGGSIYLSAGTLAGAGSIRANGGSGAGSIGGGGAGGCIAIYPTANLFAGTISAYGGGGANWGGAGTVYIQTTSQTRQLLLNNNGQSGAATPIQSVFSSSAIILSNGAVGYPLNSPETFASLLVGSNAWLTANPVSGNGSGTVNLTVTGNATVQAGGGIITDNAGSAGGLGAGAGLDGGGSPYYPGSGAGYGGYGAYNLGNSAAGGSAYGSTISPVNNGSGGGSYSTYSIGGAGGGSIRLTVNGTLDADGRISANGGNGWGLGGGGGSGGSIWLTVGTLAGAGSITANGGNGVDGVGGGGGGGRISIGYAANDFVGVMTAYGGGGYAYGGAGTVYTQGNTQSVGQLLLNNGGEIGTNTPLSSIFGTPSQPFNLTIGNGAVVCPQTSFPLLNNLTIASGGALTTFELQSLDLLVFNNVNVESGGVIAVDGEGNLLARGPGAGQSLDGDGSGAGYGGAGGASATISGGASYGSSNQPVDFGSGGGFGGGPLSGGSEGGGALRLSVGGVLTVDGQISADGEPGLQDESGGGSGGSIWVTAGTLAGNGQFTADGGEGQLYDGGGGAGGRIALYCRANIFFGLATASGAGGDFPGAEGTIYSNNVPPLQVLSNSPIGIVSNGVSSVTLYFNDAPNPNAFPATAISLTTPNGPLSSSSFSISMLSSASYLVSFPLQTAVGNYVLTVGPNINDLYGQPMLQAYTNGFTISLPVIQGAITDTNSQPVAGVLLQPSAGSSATTDTNGNYALGFVPGSSFTVTPSLGALVFLPASMSYTNVSSSISNQNYLAVSTLAPVLTAGGNATNFVVSWQGLPGANYQVYSSTDLVNWLPFGAAVTGSNGLIQIFVPTNGGPAQFFSVQAGN